MSNILEQYNEYYKNKHEYQEKIDKKVLDKKRKNDNWPYPKDEEYKPNFKLTGDIKNDIKKIKSNPEICFCCGELKDPDQLKHLTKGAS